MTAMQALGWALMHSLWQCALAAAALASLLVIIPQRAARIRYALAVATLGVMLALPLGTGLRLWDRTSPAQGEALAVGVAPASEAASFPRGGEAGPQLVPSTAASPAHSSSVAERLRAAVETALPWVVALWLGGVLLLSLRLGAGWLGTRRLKTVVTAAPPQVYVEVLSRLAARLRVSRPVRILQSAAVEVPTVIGYLRPVILLPVSALTGLTPPQLEALIAHELAHVGRHDYLVNLLQTVIETLLFYHPAVWWVSRVVRQEREYCCDDLAIAVCGDTHVYATALLSMEHLRGATPTLALAAGSGSLMGRIQRLVTPARKDTLPHWIAGIVVVTMALVIGGGSHLIGGYTVEQGPGDHLSSAPARDSTAAAPDVTVRYLDPAPPLGERWDWAYAEARQVQGRPLWIGYSVRPPASAQHAGRLVARESSETGPGLTAGAGDTGAFPFRRVRLMQLIGNGQSPEDVALLFRFSTENDEGPMLEDVYVTSFSLPIDLGDGALVWLGPADDDASLARLQTLFAEAPTAGLKELLVPAVGVHGDSHAVVPVLARWLAGDEPARVRLQAAEWLGHHPNRAAVATLSRAARGDRTAAVRQEAAEALGDNPFQAATDSLISLAGSLDDVEVRREAVQELGQKDDLQVLATLVGIAENDPDTEVQAEAVEALAELPDGAGRAALARMAQAHPHAKVRREATETLAEWFPDAEAVAVLAGIAWRDVNMHVRREAVIALGGLPDGLGVLAEMAHTHPDADVRGQAVETIAGEATPTFALEFLDEIARRDRAADVQREAVEGLAELSDDRALVLLVEFARHHPSGTVRREALQAYTRSAAPESARDLLTDRLANDRSSAVRQAALDYLVRLPDGMGIPAVVEAARNHPSREVRAEASLLLRRSSD